MARDITIEGQYANSVLGSFRIIRGFATLQQLAEISTPYIMTAPTQGPNVQGFQRSINDDHAQDIKRYLERGKLRFLPEIILSVRANLREELDDAQRSVGVVSHEIPGLTIKRRWKSRNIQTHQIRVNRADIPELIHRQRRIRRIDGNHRLHLAPSLADEPMSPHKYLAPFCAVLLGPPGDVNDDYVESMLFHTINSTALPLDSEHALALILGQAAGLAPTSEEEFASTPIIHLTRLMKARMDGLAPAQRHRLGPTPRTVLYGAARAMLATNTQLKSDRQAMETYADELYGALTDALSRMPPTAPDLCKADFFVEVASLAWKDAGIGSHDEKASRMAATLDGLGRWLGQDGFDRLRPGKSLGEQLYQLYSAVRQRVPKAVFLARWYPEASDGIEFERAAQRLDMIRRTLDDLRQEGVDLDLTDPGTVTGSTFPIHQTMYDALARNDIILVDLSGVRPNVCVEAGFALRFREKNRLILLFQRTTSTPSNMGHDRPPFDLSGYRYEPIGDAADIPSKLAPHLRAIVRGALNQA